MTAKDYKQLINYLKIHPTISRLFAEALKEVLGEGGASSEGNGVAIIGSGEGGTDGDGGNQNEGEAAVPEGGQEGEPTEEGEAKEHEQAE